jgi:DnaK suppressor protein
MAKTLAKKPAKSAPVTKKAAAAKPAAKSAKAAPAKVAASTAKPSIIPPLKMKSDYKPVKLAAGYKPTASESYMNANQLEYYRQKLLSWRKELMEESRETLDHLHEENWHQADIADRAALETEAGVELRTRNRYLKLVSKIDSAIRRIEEGEYGYCEETGEPIGLKRLEARPVATLSIEAQERHEKIEKQYTDED